MLQSDSARGGLSYRTTDTAARQVPQPYNLDITQPLIDQQANGRRKQPWAEHHAEADLLAWAYDDLGNSKKADRLRGCAPRLLFERRKDAAGQLLLPSEPGALRLHTAWFCRVRLCPICMWRRSLKIYGQTMQIVKEAQRQKPTAGWIHLTLTQRNCDGIFLGSEISNMLTAFRRITRLPWYKQYVLGCMRSIEVTHNTDYESPSYDTYHPHIHVLLCVKPSYWHKGYRSQKDWAALWRWADNLDYNPQVSVRRIKADNAAAVAEITKYATKPEGYIVPSDLQLMSDAVRVLDNALHHRRLIAWFGWLKQLHKQLALDDTEDGDLINVDGQQDAAEVGQLIAYGYAPANHNYYAERGGNHAKRPAQSP